MSNLLPARPGDGARLVLSGARPGGLLRESAPAFSGTIPVGCRTLCPIFSWNERPAVPESSLRMRSPAPRRLRPAQAVRPMGARSDEHDHR